MKIVPIFAVFASLAYAKVSYDGYKAFHIDVEDDFDEIELALAAVDYVSLSCQDLRASFDVAIGPNDLDAFEALQLNATLLTEDLGEDIKAEGELEPYSSPLRTQSGEARIPDISYFNSYRQFNDHVQYLRDLQASFSGNSRVFSVGNSVQGRAIQGIQLWGRNGAGRNPAIVWHGTVHAREWITAPTVEYMAYKLVQGYQNNDALVRNTLDRFDIFILPVVNPDGFVYTSTNDRLWRKNRQTRSGNSCVGTDVNRNWPYQWNVAGGSSTNPCAETYRGQAAGDTPENRALVSHLQSLANSVGVKSYIDWHSYSQLILLPYGYSCSARARNHASQMSVAGGVASAIRGVNGLSFQYGPTCSTIYQTAGSSTDWATDVANIEYAWGFELRPSSSGSGGFVLPASHIIPSGEENWAGMRYMFSQL